MSTLSIQLPEVLAERLRDEALRRQIALDEVVQEALEKTLPVSKTEDFLPGGSFADAAANFIGRFSGPSDLATNPRFLDDFGR